MSITIMARLATPTAVRIPTTMAVEERNEEVTKRTTEEVEDRKTKQLLILGGVILAIVAAKAADPNVESSRGRIKKPDQSLMNGTLMVLAVVTVAVVERGGVEEAMVEVAVMVMVMVVTVVVEEAAEVANPSRMAAEVERKFVVGVASIVVVTFKIASIPPHACIPAISVSHLPDTRHGHFQALQSNFT